MEKSKSTPYWGIISLSDTRLAQSNKENIDGAELIFWYKTSTKQSNEENIDGAEL